MLNDVINVSLKLARSLQLVRSSSGCGLLLTSCAITAWLYVNWCKCNGDRALYYVTPRCKGESKIESLILIDAKPQSLWNQWNITSHHVQSGAPFMLATRHFDCQRACVSVMPISSRCYHTHTRQIERWVKNNLKRRMKYELIKAYVYTMGIGWRVLLAVSEQYLLSWTEKSYSYFAIFTIYI